MTGVRILQTIPLMETKLNIKFFIIGTIITIIIIGVIAYLLRDYIYKKDLIQLCILLFFTGTGVSVICMGNFSKSIPTGKYQYKVCIDNTVSMKEFYSKYKIIDQQADIYTIEEREEENSK